MPPDLVLVATFGAPHGVKGEVRLKSHTEDPSAVVGYSPLLARDGRSFTIEAVRPAGEMLIARVREIGDRAAAEAVTRLDLFVPRARLKPAEEEDEFLHADLIGLAVVTAGGEALGTVAAVFDFGAGDVIDVARPGGRSVMIPFTRAAVPVVDIAGGRLVVDPPAGLLDEGPPPRARR